MVSNSFITLNSSPIVNTSIQFEVHTIHSQKTALHQWCNVNMLASSTVDHEFKLWSDQIGI
jgi:hypothetical protein